MLSVSDIVRNYLNEKDSEIFAEWAFGPNFITLDSTEMFEEWNKKFGSKFLLKRNSNPSKDIPFMIQFWRNKNES